MQKNVWNVLHLNLMKKAVIINNRYDNEVKCELKTIIITTTTTCIK